MASELVCAESVTRQDYISRGYQSESIHLTYIEQQKTLNGFCERNII